MLLSSGAELELADGSNVGVHAEPSVLLALCAEPRAYSAERLRAELRQSGRPFAIVAHHVFVKGKVPSDLAHHCTQVDAIEVPAKDLNRSSDYSDLARLYEKSTAGGSDAHNFVQVGACFTVLKATPDTFTHATLQDELCGGTARAEHAPGARRLVQMAKRFRAFNSSHT